MSSPPLRTLWILGASHLVVFCGALALTRGQPREGGDGESQRSPATKSPNRAARQERGDGEALLAAFQARKSESETAFEEAKRTLRAASDPEQAAMAAFEAFRAAGTDEEKLRAEAVLKARILQWFLGDPEGLMTKIVGWMASDEGGMGVMVTTTLDLAPEVIRQKGSLACVAWASGNASFSVKFWEVVGQEMKSGGGLAHYLKVRSECGRVAEAQGSLIAAEIPDAVRRILGEGFRYEERQRVLEHVLEDPASELSRDLILGFAGSGEAAATWIYDLLDRGELPEAMAKSLRGGIGNDVLMQPHMDIEKRIAARRFTPGNERKTRDAIVGELVSNDIQRLFNQGRDWRFEFRHGVASLEEVLSAVNSQLRIPAEGLVDSRIALYRTLSEEDPVKALPLLEELPEEKRRQVMFRNTWESYGSIHPDEFLRFLNKLPEPATAQEKEYRMKGWEWKARWHLQRYGDDYVEWVAALPEGPDRYAAINSVISATRERNGAKAEELNQRFYPKKP